MLRKPPWIRISLPGNNGRYREVVEVIKKYNLNTVCREARCPNAGECWGKGEATFMILGRVCTRRCKFCSTLTGNPQGHVDEDEPGRIKEAVKELKLDYIVITSVDRDDLEDQGAHIFAETVKMLKEIPVRVEVLTPDFGARENLIKEVINAGVDVFAHNIEVVEKLTDSIRDKRASYRTSLEVLRKARSIKRKILTKTGFMVGLGEEDRDVFKTLEDIREYEIDIVTIGQYLQPTRKNIPVKRYVEPEKFMEYKEYGESIGIKHVEAGPLVRSSYNAKDIYLKLTQDAQNI